MMIGMKAGFVAAMLATCGLACASPAQADLVSIGLQEAGVNGGAITTMASGISTASFTGPFGSFSTVTASVSPSAAPASLLFSELAATSSAAAGTLTIWITEQDITGTTGATALLNSFTVDDLPSGWTMTGQTFYDAGNGLFSTATPLGSAGFTGTGTQTALGNATLTAPFSITHEYTVTATGSGTINGSTDTTVNAAAVPEPGSLALLGGGLCGLALLGGAGLRRQRA
jgi:hypothetical protein